MYADDTQLYVSFKPGEVNAQDEAIRAMEDYIKDIRNWLIESRLLLNDDKTEFLVIGTRQQLSKLSLSVLHVGDHTINHSVSVRNLGSVFDNSLSMDSHINQLCKTAFYHIHNISKNSNHLLQESLKSVTPKISRIVRQKQKNEFYLIWSKEPIWLPVFGNDIKRIDFLFFSSKFAKLENSAIGPSAASMRLEI